MMSVAWPRIFGPSTEQRDADDGEDDDGDHAEALGAHRPSRRLAEPPKSFDFSAGMPHREAPDRRLRRARSAAGTSAARRSSVVRVEVVSSVAHAAASSALICDATISA